METTELLNLIKNRLTTHYGVRLAGLILYGSEARGEASQESDVDLLVLLQGSFERLNELRIIVELLYPLQLSTNRLLSARPTSVEDYRADRLQLYRNAKLEGYQL